MAEIQAPTPSRYGFRAVAGWAFRTALIVVVLFVTARFTVPLVVLEPGPPRDVAEITKIERAPTFKSQGSFLITTALVESPEGVTIPMAIRAALDPRKDVIPKQAVFPSQFTRTQTDQLHTAQMSESQQSAAVAALHEAGMSAQPDGVFVRNTTPGSPAARKLRPGDIITTVDGVAVQRIEDLTGHVGRLKPGDAVKVNIKRGDRAMKLFVKTVGSSQGASRTRLGVSVVESYKLPIDIEIKADEIGGASAGFVFALGIYDFLNSHDLTAGRKIAGTGTISNGKDKFGLVGEVGAITQKVRAAEDAGAEVFVAPKANLEEARSATSGDMKIIGATTLRQAINALKIR